MSVASEEDKFLLFVLLWINGDKEFLEIFSLPPIEVRNKELYEKGTRRKLKLSKKGHKNFLNAVTKLKSQGLIREDNMGNILLTRTGYYKAEGLVEGYFDLENIRERGIYLYDDSWEERKLREEKRRRRIIGDRKRQLEG